MIWLGPWNIFGRDDGEWNVHCTEGVEWTKGMKAGNMSLEQGLDCQDDLRRVAGENVESACDIASFL